MAKPQRVTYFKVDIEDKPGALLAVAKDLKSRKVGLVALRALHAEVYLIAKNPERLREALKASSTTFQEGTSFFVRGTDQTGALVKTLEAIAQAGINIQATDAIAVGGKYGSFFQVALGDVERAAKALGAR
jgi:hypothetical protein